MKGENLREEMKGTEEESGRSRMNYRGSPGVRRETANANEIRVGRPRRTSRAKEERQRAKKDNGPEIHSGYVRKPIWAFLCWEG